MENVHNDLCTLFVLRANESAAFNKLADDVLAGRAFRPVEIEVLDFLPWQLIVNRLATVNYRTVAKFKRFVKQAAKGEVDAAVCYIGLNAIDNGGRLSTYALNATLSSHTPTAAESDGSTIKRKCRLSSNAWQSEKSDCVNLFRLLDFLEVDAGHQKHNKEIKFTAAALAFFRSL